MDQSRIQMLNDKLNELVVYHVRDGWASVYNKASDTLYEDVTFDRCTCEDSRRNNGGTYFFGGRCRCKHQIAAMLSYPCAHCHVEGGMRWNPNHDIYECPECGNARDGKLVREERKAANPSGSVQIERADRIAWEVGAMVLRCDKCGKRFDRMLIVEVELKDRIIRLCESCADMVADQLTRELFRMKQLLESGI